MIYYILTEQVSLKAVGISDASAYINAHIFVKIFSGEDWADVKQKLYRHLNGKFTITEDSEHAMSYHGVALYGTMKNQEHKIL